MVGKGLRALICVLVVTSVVFVVGSPAVAMADIGSSSPAVVQQDSADELTLQDADTIVTEIQLQPDGNATVFVDYQYRLNESETQWQNLRDDVNSNNQTYIEEESGSWQETLEDGQNETGRDMNLSGFTVETDETSNPREYGHVQFSFEWESFAYVELNRMEAGDALAGFMLDDASELRISWPDTYNMTTVEPEPQSVEDNVATWDGESSGFDTQPLQVELIEESQPPNESPAGNDDPQSMPVETLAAAAVLVAVTTTAVVAGWLFRRDGDEPVTAPENDAEPAESVATDADQGTVPPPELLSNEERVLQLLEDRGGRLKQQQVVSELDWTEAKTSQVVRGLREDDEVDVFRIGRENVLTLSEESDEE
ncbi:helix-turn-helix transcriptional regulator [Halostagnicola kamekurae]|uniref:IclR helix-turn-helix domain-containing protein n=1 Tax=Halostagnicola kamekurae TaxID=619731 RepID=A0A1I6PH24_9EURY|nr:hypothetical protein [Halostagnicola kamekurae]SFS39398.1 hypothetical protein SAMN04488556_0546 [Halostagnicola kamekurae]